MGFNLAPGVPRRSALEALEKFAWDDLKCLHLEVSDPNFTFEDGENTGFKTEHYASYRTDLTCFRRRNIQRHGERVPEMHPQSRKKWPQD